MPSTVKEYLERGPATSKEIQAATGLSQPAVSRRLRKLGDSVVRMRKGRTVLYFATGNAFNSSNKLPLYMVDARGDSVLTAYIRPLLDNGFFVEPVSGMPRLLSGNRGNGLYDDLPYFLMDLCPQGFLGRQIAREMAVRSDDFPSDPRRWNTNHLGRFLIANGEDLPGNIILGEQARIRMRPRPVAVPDADYPVLADRVMDGLLPGSSAGGEQPKFTAFSEKNSAHVIVKFSPKGDNVLAKRWRDILLTEFHAAKTIHSYGFAAAETRLIDLQGRLFLESKRFDRSAEFGRMSMISLQAIDAEFSGTGSNWPRAIAALHQRGLISGQHLSDAESLWYFGRLINNQDMHLGNMSLAIEGDIFTLLPIYDMCSMGFAPRGGGEVPEYRFTPTIPQTINLRKSDFEQEKKMAVLFWEQLAGDPRISNGLRDFLARENPAEIIGRMQH